MRWIVAITIAVGLTLSSCMLWLSCGRGLIRSVSEFNPLSATMSMADACHVARRILPGMELKHLDAPLFVAENHLSTQIVRQYPCIPARTKNLSRELHEINNAAHLRMGLRNVELSTIYLNLSYFGEGQWGVAAGSEHYFHVPPDKLSISQAALLIALLRSPGMYSPTKHPDLALNRRNKIIQGELERLSISELEAKDAMAAPLDR